MARRGSRCRVGSIRGGSTTWHTSGGPAVKMAPKPSPTEMNPAQGGQMTAARRVAASSPSGSALTAGFAVTAGFAATAAIRR